MMMLVVYPLAIVAFFALIQGSLMLLERGGTAAPDPQAPSLRRKALVDEGGPWLSFFLLSSPVQSLDALVKSSGLGRSTASVLIFMSIATTVAAVAVSVTGQGPVLCLLAGAIVGVALPLIVLLRRRRQRFAKFTDQLPEAIFMLVRSIQAGHPITAGIGMLAKQMPDPLGGEMQLVFDAMSYGLDLRQALEKLTQRVPVEELHYMVAAIRIQYAAGGGLAEILSLLGHVMRERKKLRMKVIAMSAESRWSGYILAAMPILLVGGLIGLNPGYYDDVHTNSLLVYILAGAAILVVSGFVMVKRIVNIEI